MTYQPTPIEIERRNRIKLSLYAYAYEFEGDSLVSDGEYDDLSLKIDKSVKTGNKKLDTFFNREFDPHTGMWIRKHPELDKLKALYFMHKQDYNAKYIRIGAEIYVRAE